MKQTKLIMGMPITLEIVDEHVSGKDFHDIFAFFRTVDQKFSPYKKLSEVSKINRKELTVNEYSQEMLEILNLSQEVKKKTQGYFDVYHKGYLDPSGIVKGWAIQKAAEMLRMRGFRNFFIDAGGDIQVDGLKNGKKWRVGIKNPFNTDEIIKVIYLSNEAIATSGTYIRGEHIYNPLKKNKKIVEIVSLSVLSKTILEADLLATAAFAMGKKGIEFINSFPEADGYMIDHKGHATYTQGFIR
jgi:thiamine biosynthesis lipoprotein